MAVLGFFLAAMAVRAKPVELSSRVITLPVNAGQTLFVDVEGNGRCSLLAIDPPGNRLLNYLPGPDGFASSPGQVITLPPQTAWVAACEVDPHRAHPGLELLASTATGLVSCRPNAGRFETEWHTLIKARQVFTNANFPILTSLATNATGTNLLIPVISADQAVLYHQAKDGAWSPEPALPFTEQPTAWHINRDDWDESWALGSQRAFNLQIQKTFRVQPEPHHDQPPTNTVVLKLLADLGKNTSAWPPQARFVDIDGDGQPDLVIWQVSGRLDFKTDVYLFRRGADQNLPDRPAQVLHCRGLPIPSGPTDMPSPVLDLNGDGHYELVLFEFNYGIASASGILERALSHGLDCSLTIRSFHNHVFSSSPDASVPVTVILSAEVLNGSPFFIQGDFNADGRPDLLVRRSDTEWNIFSSTRDGRWFESQPAMTFHVPSQGYMEIKDLNGDGLSDVIWHEPEANRLSIFMSPAPPAKGKNP